MVGPLRSLSPGTDFLFGRTVEGALVQTTLGLVVAVPVFGAGGEQGLFFLLEGKVLDLVGEVIVAGGGDVVPVVELCLVGAEGGVDEALLGFSFLLGGELVAEDRDVLVVFWLDGLQLFHVVVGLPVVVVLVHARLVAFPPALLK